MASTAATAANNKSTLKPNERPPPPGPKNFVEWYLLSYNQVSLLGWTWIMYQTISQIQNDNGDFDGVFERVWPSLSYVQTAAVCEIIHAMLGWVKASPMVTAVQVASRLFLVWGVNALVPQIHTHWSFSSMVIAWSIGECVRYMYYILQLSGGVVPKFVKWARYNLFFILYPVGVFSEMTMVYQALPYAKAMSPLYYYALIVTAAVYAPGFPVMFSHMLIQRKKFVRGELEKKEKKQQ